MTTEARKQLDGITNISRVKCKECYTVNKVKNKSKI